MGVILSDGDDGAGCNVSLSNFRIVAAVEEALALVFTAGSDGGWGMVHSELPDDPERIDFLLRKIIRIFMLNLLYWLY
jgi:hypothetical protein